MFKDKKYTAIITGGSRGVGAAAAKKLASHGWNVLITCSSSIDEAENIANQSDDLSGEIVAIQADVSNQKDCDATIERCVSLWGGLDSLINNAGTCLLYTSPSPRDLTASRMPSSA